jgi:SAM-dependent methyltransferase
LGIDFFKPPKVIQRYAMRQIIREFVTIVAECIPIQDPIYEFGSLQVTGQERLADLRPLFPGREYIGADMRNGTGVDKILDLCAIDLPSASVGTVLCMDTLEHVEYTRKALDEIYRILKPNGMAVISSVMCFPIHDHPYDYWRFTPEAFRSLLKHFNSSFVGFSGKKDFPHTIVGIGFKGKSPEMDDFNVKFKLWQNSQRTLESLSKLTLLRRLLVPPIFSRSSRRELGF